MKKQAIIRWILMGIIMLINIDCKKDDPWESTFINPQPPPPRTRPSSFYYPSVCRAGSDKLVFFPVDFCNLYGSISGTFKTAQWRKISGPSSFVFEDAGALSAKLTKLEIGVYQFELAVFDTAGMAVTDTCSVIVNRFSANPGEIVLENLTWATDGLLWGSEIIVPDVYQYLPPGSVFRAYIKRDQSGTWEVLVPDDTTTSYYVMSLVHGDLSAWSSFGETDTPDIK